MQIKNAYNRQDVQQVVASLGADGYEVYPTGSAYFNDYGQDIDVILVGGPYTPLGLMRQGYVPCAATEYPDERYWTGRLGPVNVICTKDSTTAEAWVRASLALARLAAIGITLPKAGRCAVFESIIDSEDPYMDLCQLDETQLTNV